jgi:hypothetical protein
LEFEIEIESRRVDPLMRLFNNELEGVAEHLKLMNDRMVLVNPKFDHPQQSQVDE